MATQEPEVAALVYDYLKKNVTALADTFKAKVNPVSFCAYVTAGCSRHL